MEIGKREIKDQSAGKSSDGEFVNHASENQRISIARSCATNLRGLSKLWYDQERQLKRWPVEGKTVLQSELSVVCAHDSVTLSSMSVSTLVNLGENRLRRTTGHVRKFTMICSLPDSIVQPASQSQNGSTRECL